MILYTSGIVPVSAYVRGSAGSFCAPADKIFRTHTA